MQVSAAWFAIGVFCASLMLARARAQDSPAEPPPTEDDYAITPESIADVPPGAVDTATPAPEPVAPQPTAAQPPPPPEPAPGPDPVFAEWGEPGAKPPPPLGPRVQAALMAGLGAALNKTAGSINPLGFGFGFRGGYTVIPEVVVGGRFLYYIGGSAALPTGEISMSSWLLAVEGAYVWQVKENIVIEPGLALGLSTLSVRGPRVPSIEGGAGFVPGSTEQTDVAFYLAPGAAVRIPVDISPDLEGAFVGGDVRLGFAFRDVVGTSIEVMGQAGIRF
jgi:hypothetical protein